jgi:hypothetical protein
MGQDGALEGSQTSQDYLANHEITKELRRRGVTEDQLAAMRFRTSSRRERPFADWSFTWADGTPLEVLPYVKPYCALKWLTLDDPPAARDKDDAWEYVNNATIAPVVAIGLKHQEEQRGRARRSRVKITEEGETIGQLVERLANSPEHREESARGLWFHFFALLDQIGADPEELASSDPRKQAYKYAFREKRRKISYGQFANLVSVARSKKSG